jgi:hypothetical protein
MAVYPNEIYSVFGPATLKISRCPQAMYPGPIQEHVC